VLVVSDRDEIVKAARELDASALGCARESARYERADDRELAAAIDVVSAHGSADALTGDREHGHHGARIGRYVLWSDRQRVAALQTFANELAAAMMLELGGSTWLAAPSIAQMASASAGTCSGAMRGGRSSRCKPTQTSGAPRGR
jgi:hypothetical protein